MKKYSIELLKQYHKELFINIVLLLAVCVLSIAGPVILKNGWMKWNKISTSFFIYIINHF